MGLRGNDNLDESLWPIRALRATPPGLADSERRGEVFHAAIEQFEQLLRAGETIGPASSPILTYYALNQAGRAILAAHGPADAWEVHGHGLSIAERVPIGETKITPKGDGLFQAVAATTGSPPLTRPITLSEAWGACPQFPRAPGLGDESPPLLLFSGSGGGAEIRSEDGGPFPFEEFWDRKTLYPGASDATIEEAGGFTGRHQGHSIFRVVSYPTEEAKLRLEGSLVDFYGRRYLRVPLGDAEDQPSGLMTWWIVLLALSSLARYEPAGWTAALAPNSPLAVPIEQSLNRATLMLPGMVLEALTRGGSRDLI